MEPPSRNAKTYPIIPKNRQAANYDRVARVLSNADLRDELDLGRGDPGYQEALRTEAKRRGIGVRAGR